MKITINRHQSWDDTIVRIICKIFKAAIIKTLQWATINMFETKSKVSQRNNEVSAK